MSQHLIEKINQEIESKTNCMDKLDALIEKHKLCDNYCRIPNLNIPEHEAEEACDECEIRKALHAAWNIGYRVGIASGLQAIQK